jgi:long-chain acyl-CoA synthetase
VLETIAKNRVTTMVAVPSMYRALLRSLERQADISSLQLPISGGEPLPEEVFEAYRGRHGVTLLEGYGLTETSPVVSANTPGATKPFTVGRPLPRVEVRVVDESGEDAGINADGEIWVRAASVMEGYLGLPEDTRESITWNGFLRTGDIGRIDQEGYLKITGRKKEMMISAGENIFPREIELVVAKHPAVAEVAVIGIPDEVRGEAPKAFVVLKEGTSATADEIKEFCREHIAKFKVPAEVEFRKEFPHSPTGKILKQRLVRPGPGTAGGRH